MPAPRAPSAALLVPLLLFGCSTADARTIAVKDDAGLAAAVAKARPGDRIELAAGRYGPLAIGGRRIDGPPVTIAGRGAHIVNIAILKSSGWTLDGLEIGGELDERARFLRVEDSGNIRILNGLIRGQNVNNDPWDDGGVAVGLRRVENVEIRNTRFRDVKLALQVGSSRNVTVAGNSFAWIREGINWVAVTGGAIRCNRISHVFANYGLKEHPDAIQFWSNKDGGSSDILVEGNFLNLGGPRAVHGIFGHGIRREDQDPERRNRRFTIRDNIYYGSALHGISLGGFTDTVVERNTVLGSDHVRIVPAPPRSADGRASSALVPKVRLMNYGTTGRIAGNIATGISGDKGVVVENNLQVRIRDGSGERWDRVFTNPPSGPDPRFEDFAVSPKSRAARDGQGARPVCGTELPPAP